MALFWLFTFEGFNGGLLGDQPTNNRSIEVQLIQRFTVDNAYLQLPHYEPSVHEPSYIDSLFQHTVVDRAHNFDSVKHLDTSMSRATDFSSGFEFVPSCEYTLAALSHSHVEILSWIYGMIYPSLPAVCLPQSFRRMPSVTINGSKYVLGNNMF